MFNFWTSSLICWVILLASSLLFYEEQYEIIAASTIMFSFTVVSHLVMKFSEKVSMKTFMVFISGNSVFKFIFVGIILVIIAKMTSLDLISFAIAFIASYVLFTAIEIFYLYRQLVNKQIHKS